MPNIVMVGILQALGEKESPEFPHRLPRAALAGLGAGPSSRP